jgi:putative ABC transport system permease protein
MLKNYLKIALRILRRYKAYSFINIAGLAIGMACCLLILAYVRHELSYDRYHKNAGQIYRVFEELDLPGNKSQMAVTPAPFAPAMENDFKEVVNAVRFMSSENIGNKVLVSFKDNHFYEDKWFYADDSVFDIFTFPLVKGNPRTALKEPLSVVVTEEAAKKYFGDEDPIRKVLTVTDEYNQNDFLITGVLKNIPPNSHFRFDFLASFITVEKHYRFNLTNWFNHAYYTYLLLEQGSNPKDLEKKFPALIEKYAGKEGASVLKPHLQPLASIHLHSHLQHEIEANSDIVYVYVFSATAFFILLIACINFMNLATARYACRTREVGVRKVIGARRPQLVQQFLGESILFSLIALPVSILLVELLLPAFSSLIGRKLVFNYFSNWQVLIGLLGVTFFVGCLSGIYPAFFLSAFEPVRVLKGRMVSGSRGTHLRKGLIVFQFAISIILMVSTAVIMNQVNYLRTKKLGFQKEQVLVLPLRSKEVRANHELLKNEFLKNPRIMNVTMSSGLPGRIHYYWVINSQLTGELLGANKKIMTAWVLMVDHDFLKTMGMELVKGRDFSPDFATDEKQAVIINESAAKEFGWTSPLGMRVKTENMDGYVIGVVKDFHFRPLYQAIEPIVIYIKPSFFEYASMRISPNDIPSTLAYLKDRWNALAPNQPFEYFFLDSDFDSVYRSEERVGKLTASSTLLAVFIACLGLFGLASFTAEQRTKEIGIRKVLGASIPAIVRLLTREFTKWVVVANVVAWPVSYYVMHRWLQNFAYRTSIGLWNFLLAAAMTFAVALLTVSYQAVKAALANPVKALRYE